MGAVTMLLRAFLALWLALPAAAALVAPEAAGLAARAEGYQAALNVYDRTAAAGFLADPAAQGWFASERPQFAVPALQRAHEILDLSALPARYEDAAGLRRALIARDSEPSSEKPDSLLAMYSAWDLPADQRKRVEQALVEWRTLDPDLRGWLTEAGLTSGAWRDLRLSERCEAVVRALMIHVLGTRPLAVDGKAYQARMASFVERASPFLSPAEDYLLDQKSRRFQELAVRLRRLREAARRSGDETAKALVAKTARQGPDAVSELLDRVDAGTGEAPRTVPIPPGVIRSVQARLPAAIRRIVAGTTAEPVISEALERVLLSHHETAQGGYEARRDRLIVDRALLEGFLAERGRPAGDLLTDPALLDAFALEIAPIVVHETTHRLQSLRARAAGLDYFDQSALYGQEDEREAYTVQLAFVRAFAAAHPEKAAALAANDRLDFFWSEELVLKTRALVHVGYANVPSFHGSRARAVTLAHWRAADARRRLPAIEAELAVAGERTGAPGSSALGGKLEKMSAAALRTMRRAAEPYSELGLAKAYIAYLDAMDARIRAWDAAP